MSAAISARTSTDHLPRLGTAGMIETLNPSAGFGSKGGLGAETPRPFRVPDATSRPGPSGTPDSP